jgi:hypothetical protein
MRSCCGVDPSDKSAIQRPTKECRAHHEPCGSQGGGPLNLTGVLGRRADVSLVCPRQRRLRRARRDGTLRTVRRATPITLRTC